MLVTVRQLVQESCRNMNSIHNDNERIDFAKDQLKNNNYIRVADLETLNFATGMSDMSIAFELTNSVSRAWYENTDINVSEMAKNGCRSTSVGDIIQMEGTSYLVSPFGFTKL